MGIRSRLWRSKTGSDSFPSTLYDSLRIRTTLFHSQLINVIEFGVILPLHPLPFTV